MAQIPTYLVAVGRITKYPTPLFSAGSQDVRSSISEKTVILSRMPTSRVEPCTGMVSGPDQRQLAHFCEILPNQEARYKFSWLDPIADLLNLQMNMLGLFQHSF